MAVDIGDVLHVLAHELRTPAGIAQGYVRMLLEGRLAEDGDRQRALEQTRKALSRVGELSREASDLATWLERDRQLDRRKLAPADLIARLHHLDVDPPLVVRSEIADAHGIVRAEHDASLEAAIATMVRATAREIRGTCTVRVVGRQAALDVLIGPDDHTSLLTGGPEAEGAAALALERGGLGLAMVHAALVLEAHDAVCWTMGSARQMLGIRLPLHESR